MIKSRSGARSKIKKWLLENAAKKTTKSKTGIEKPGSVKPEAPADSKKEDAKASKKK